MQVAAPGVASIRDHLLKAMYVRRRQRIQLQPIGCRQIHRWASGFGGARHIALRHGQRLHSWCIGRFRDNLRESHRLCLRQ